MRSLASRYTRPANVDKSWGTDEDAITPCPPAPVLAQPLGWEHLQQQQYAQRTSSSSTSPTSQTTSASSASPPPSEVTHPHPTPSRSQSMRSSSNRWRTSWRDSLDEEGRILPDRLELTDSPPAAGAAAAAEQQQIYDVDPEMLWRRMLAIQRVFGCYNSARMRAALDENWQASHLAPSRTCLELLNDSIDQLPEHVRRELDQFLMCSGSLAPPSASPSSSTKRMSWRRRLLRIPAPR